MAQLKDTTINGNLDVSEHIFLENGKIIYGKTTNGENRSMVQFNGNNQAVFGYGGYNNSEGASYFDGNNVNIRSKNGIYMTSPNAGLTAREYGVNKVLWTGGDGGYYMTDTHRISLSENVSAQPNGIVLVWSMYTNGNAENSAFNYTFVPKQHITSFGGCGVSCFLTGYANSTGTNALGFKYVYVNNNSIVGNVRNNYAGESNGLTLANNRFVLRQVIGV